MQNPSPTFVTKGEGIAKKSENYTYNYDKLLMEGGLLSHDDDDDHDDCTVKLFIPPYDICKFCC